MPRVKLSSLVLDYNLYPRTELDAVNTRRIIEAIRLGRRLPPIVADRKSKRVIDGFHRHRGYSMVEGPDAEVMVEWEEYGSENDMYLDAIRRNSVHGKPLTPLDRDRCLLHADELKIDRVTAAAALGITKTTLGDIEKRRFAEGPRGALVVKGSVSHLADKHLTAVQEEANEHAGGFAQVYYVDQVINFIEGELLPEENVRLYERLRYLHELLGRVKAAV